jgi:dGTPase
VAKLPPLYRPSDYERRNPVSKPDFTDPDAHWRSPFVRDYARLVHCPAFRRLQGKTQVVGNTEMDFFRNRLTHSMEVAQIAKSITTKFNSKETYFKANPISLELIEFAALAHDLGHPPFGHTGELALDDAMVAAGGFEGNAQTLRVISRLEKKLEHAPDEQARAYPDPLQSVENRYGLNLTARSLAAVLKYDAAIPGVRPEGAELVKGYYECDSAAVQFLKAKVCGDKWRPCLRTIECSIMDCADDIAFSTYDLEDAFKAGFIRPINLITANASLMADVAARANRSLTGTVLTAETATDELYRFFDDYLLPYEHTPCDVDDAFSVLSLAAEVYVTAREYGHDGYTRSAVTARLVSRFVNAVQVELDPVCPALSRAYVREEDRVLIEILKNFVFCKTIQSPELRHADYSGRRIVRQMFDALLEGGSQLMPYDYRAILSKVPERDRVRVVCDFLAGMTDRYAVEFHGRLFSEKPATVFKPVL